MTNRGDGVTDVDACTGLAARGCLNEEHCRVRSEKPKATLWWLNMYTPKTAIWPPYWLQQLWLQSSQRGRWMDGWKEFGHCDVSWCLSWLMLVCFCAAWRASSLLGRTAWIPVHLPWPYTHHQDTICRSSQSYQGACMGLI